MLCNLEESGDFLHKFSRYAHNKKMTFMDESIAYMKGVRELLVEYQKIFFKFRQQDAEKTA